MRYLYEQSRKAIPDLPDFDTFRQQGIYKPVSYTHLGRRARGGGDPGQTVCRA